MPDTSAQMCIEELHIENFKGFRGAFDLSFNKELNILVGDNEAGKSTILEAINLVLTGALNGRFVRHCLTQYLFNRDVIEQYIQSLSTDNPNPPPYILIELYLDGNNLAQLKGNGNSKGESKEGISLKIAFDEKFKTEYQELIKAGSLKTIPIEYYDVTWQSFAREAVTSRSIPLKASLIDSSTHRYQSGSDIYISRIVKEHLEREDIVAISQAHRKMQEGFLSEPSIDAINQKIKEAADISQKNIKISVDLATRNAWESSLMTYLDDVPFHYVGKGEQTIIKTKLSLSHKKTQEANVILLEEPENHLSHSRLNQLIFDLKAGSPGKQVIVSTHSSFVANKLGLKSLILLNNQTPTTFDKLTEDTMEFFEKLSGFDTLRLLLCQKAILVEGASDELIVQKAYKDNHDGKLPIENGIDVISVGLSFLRFLEIADQIKKPVAVITDNDGNIEAIEAKYSDYLGENEKEYIGIFYDSVVDECADIDGEAFNCNTLEPKFVKANSLEKMNEVFGMRYENLNDLHKHMKNNKTDCALCIFNYSDEIDYPPYILGAIADE